jgi:ADP-ribose pyrophosphatase YjhB (NUDIX family)
MNGPSTISLPLNGGLFNFRVAGVAIYNDCILLHKTPSDNFWSLPGGRVDMFEFTKETLLREMVEETVTMVKSITKSDFTTKCRFRILNSRMISIL